MKCWPNLREISLLNRLQLGSVAVEENCTEAKSNKIRWMLLNSSMLIETVSPVRASFAPQLQRLGSGMNFAVNSHFCEKEIVVHMALTRSFNREHRKTSITTPRLLSFLQILTNFCSTNIPSPLSHHPCQSSRTDKHGSRQARPPSSGAEHQPLGRKMSQRDSIRPQRQLVHQRIRDVVGSVQTNDGGEEGPGAKGSGRERVHGARGGGVDARRVRQSEV